MKKTALFLATAVLGFSSVSLGWGEVGHQVTAEIAERLLNEKGRQLVLSILGPEPMQIAAVWPDLVRGDRARYQSFAAFHLCDLPASVLPADYEASLTAERNCLSILRQGARQLIDPAVERDRKIILMRYLIHVAGDVHQPLHIGNKLDLGANLCQVKVTEKKRLVQKNLHSVWDGVIVEAAMSDLKRADRTKGFDAFLGFADSLMKRKQQIAADAEISSDPLQWIVESSRIRSTKAYPDSLAGFLGTDERQRPYCEFMEFDGRLRIPRKTFFDEKRIPVLDEDYMNQSKEVVKRQLLVGGMRLASLLNRLGEEAVGLPTRTDQDFLQELLRSLSPVLGSEIRTRN